MKLKNKKTGEIIETQEIYENLGGKIRIRKKAEEIDSYEYMYNSLAELNEEWQDYEEPKRTWFIDTWGSIRELEAMEMPVGWEDKPILEFDNKKQAELALRKLKAWKRLKDKGFRFTLTPGVGSLDIDPGKFQIEINADMPTKWFCCDAVQEDLDDCFGGEE